jgi:hypothetical protein
LGIRTSNKLGGLILDIIYSQAKRIYNGDPDLLQNILTFNHSNLQSANARGKSLSIGEQVTFMKHRASELRSGVRHFVGHGQYKGKDDVYSPLPYLRGDIKVHHFDYADGENEECIGDGKGELTFTTSIKHLEDELVFKLDLNAFKSMLQPIERQIFLSRLAGYSVNEIADELALTSSSVRKYLADLGVAFKSWFLMT